MKRLLTCVALITIMVGCKEPLPEEPIIPEGKLPINLSLSTTRANDGSYEAGDQIGLYVANYADGTATQLASSGNHVNNMQFTLNDNSWTPATKIYWKDKSTRADFYAYYPYQNTVADVTALPVSVQADQSSEDNYWASDLLWGKTSGVAPTESVVNIATSHALSNLLIYVEPGYGFTAENLAAANVSVEINNVKTAGALNLTNGVVTASGEVGTITPWNTGDYYRALIVPQTVAEETTLITVTVDGKAHTIKQGFTFVANTQHKFVVRVEQDIETKVTLSINPWNQDPNINGDTAKPNNEIWYTATEKIIPYNMDQYGNEVGYIDMFGANLISNEWNEETREGVMTFDGAVTCIGYNAFHFCHNLTSITIPESVISIGGFAFYCCDGLTSITIPEYITSIGDGAFSDCSLKEFNGKYASADARCLIIDGDLIAFAPAELTEYIVPKGVTSIRMCAFEGCSNLTTITIPEGVTEIGNAAFNGCSSLKTITIPEGVTSIGGTAFWLCRSMTTITIPESVTSIGGGAFSGCSSLTSITIPEGVTEIGNYTFSSCSSLTSITIPESVTEIGNYTFSSCHSLTTITIPEYITSIGGGAFSGCRSLEEFNGKYASEDNRCLIVDGALNSFAPAGLTEYIIPEGVTSVGHGAFSGCQSLVSITIPDCVTSIGNSAFSGCKSLVSITIPESVTSIGNSAFSGCSSLTSITLPEGVTSISDYTFSGCSSLTSITIPEGVTSIGNQSFKMCSSITSFTIPESVTSIGDDAFRECTSLVNVYCKPSTPPNLGSYLYSLYVFSLNGAGRKFYVPASEDDLIIKKYKNDVCWREYADAIEEYEFD